MALFDKLKGADGIKLSPNAGLLLTAITIIAADGDIDDDELHILMRIDRKNDGSFDEAVKVWKTHSYEECVSIATNAMDQKQRLGIT